MAKHQVRMAFRNIVLALPLLVSSPAWADRCADMWLKVSHIKASVHAASREEKRVDRIKPALSADTKLCEAERRVIDEATELILSAGEYRGCSNIDRLVEGAKDITKGSAAIAGLHGCRY